MGIRGNRWIKDSQDAKVNGYCQLYHIKDQRNADALYQYNRNGNHLGTAMVDGYFSKEQEAERFLRKLHGWWESK